MLRDATPEEHLGLPDVDAVRQGIIAHKTGRPDRRPVSPSGRASRP
jgi:hypothetical protein